MKIHAVLIVIFSILLGEALCQPSAGASTTKYYGGYMDLNLRTPLGKKVDVAKAYLNKTWNFSEISISQQEKIDIKYPSKYNLLDNTMEMMTPDGLRGLSAEKISSVRWTDSVTKAKSYFISGMSFMIKGKPIRELMEVLEDGELVLLKRTFATIAEAVNVPGQTKTWNAEPEIHIEYYIIENKTLVRIKREKDLLNHFGKAETEVVAFIDNEKLNVKNEDDLIKVMHYYNSRQGGTIKN